MAASTARVNRRDLLAYSLATSVAVWAGRGLAGGGLTEAQAAELFTVRRVSPERFPQSVASGDPRPDGIVLWTRVAPPPGTGPIRVAYEIAHDADTEFARPVLRGVAVTDRGRDHTVKVALQRAELEPFRRYRYRFVTGGEASRSGHFRTLPDAGAHVAGIRLGYISCQDYTNGFYTALEHLADEDVDYIVHLGDYIYETVPPEGGRNSFQGGGPPQRHFRFPRDGAADEGLEATTVDDYRLAYRTYRSDRNLQRVHENFAVIAIWDDHEFVNDCYGTHLSDQHDPPSRPRRRAAANQAWAEYTPAAVAYNPAVPDPVEEIRTYRSFAFGDLAELVLTDERLYRDPHPCGEQTTDKYLTPGCDAIDAPERTMLGTRQKEFFLDRITGSRCTWKIWANETMVMQLKLLNTYLGSAAASLLPELAPSDRADGIYLNLDQWDGYQAERREIARRIRRAGTENVVTITGDIHSFAAGYLKENYDNPLNKPPNTVGTAFVCGSVTSSNIAELARIARLTGRSGDLPVLGGLSTGGISALQTVLGKVSNPHLEFLDSTAHGYNLLEITHSALICTMKSVDTIQRSQAAVRTLARFRVPAGRAQIERTDLPM